ncbi:MAG: hypothetical protein ACOZCO_01490 [Bacteroidota bacterium]
MLEIIIMALVVSAFVRQARTKKQNPVLWGIIAAVSFYGPVLLTGWFVFPFMMEQGWYAPKSEGEAIVVVLASSIAVGIICCFISWRILKNIPDKKTEYEENVIDGIN